MGGELLVGLVLVGVFVFICIHALDRAASITDRQAKRDYLRMVTPKHVERRYWNDRYPGRHWPGR